MGTLVEWTAMDLVLRHAPRATATEKQDGLAAAGALFAAAGITWVQEAALSPADVEAYLATAAAGRLPVRANVALRADPGRWPAPARRVRRRPRRRPPPRRSPTRCRCGP